ncbi:MAG TPA: hypothetical protein VJ720_13945 [Chitinophaga sp.]|nr:hypothetical protein [Chitinophaga sp.]
MEVVAKLVELLKNSFKEMVIIALVYLNYVQYGDNKAWQSKYELSIQQSREREVNIFREVMNKTDKVMDRTNYIVDKADTIIAKRYDH